MFGSITPSEPWPTFRTPSTPSTQSAQLDSCRMRRTSASTQPRRCRISTPRCLQCSRCQVCGTISVLLMAAFDHTWSAQATPPIFVGSTCVYSTPTCAPRHTSPTTQSRCSSDTWRRPSPPVLPAPPARGTVDSTSGATWGRTGRCYLTQAWYSPPHRGLSHGRSTRYGTRSQLTVSLCGRPSMPGGMTATPHRPGTKIRSGIRRARRPLWTKWLTLATASMLHLFQRTLAAFSPTQPAGAIRGTDHCALSFLSAVL
mmetsp:Transcript_23228/g.60790  ORF Transcript_23228/g.60790 Transcript_23228/m.60790 type:complete len:257 (-) Transcript_23228:20-790(-)